eukprot:5865906-Heterocapsa_arctica.AAC.1
MLSCSAAMAMAEWVPADDPYMCTCLDPPREVSPHMRSQMWRTSMRSPGSSWARGPSERGSVVLRGGPS